MISIILQTVARTEDDTTAFAARCREIIPAGSVVCLHGTLGAGKTFFVKRFAEMVGIKNAASPTFAIVNVYQGDLKINHFDFYRIRKKEELLDIGLYEYTSDEDAITFIEWADMYPELLPRHRFELTIDLPEPHLRKITLSKVDDE